jgi:hypothetical protein
MDQLRTYIGTRHFSALPAPIWFLFASPLLAFAIGGRPFKWPHGCSKSPFRKSFWHVGSGY